MKNTTQRVAALALTVCLGATSAVSAFAEAKLTERAKQEMFESGRIAMFETMGGTPFFKVFHPFAYEVKTYAFAKDLSSLDLVKQTTLNYGPKKIFEEFYQGSGKTGFDRLFRADQEKPNLDPVAEVYLRGIPTVWKLSNYKELELMVNNVRTSFENAGLVAGSEKPLLVISVDARTINLELSEDDAKFLSEFYTLASFADADVRNFFHDQQDLMVRRSDDTYAAGHKDFVNDGYLEAISRKMNGNYKKLNARNMVAEGVASTVGALPKIILSGLVTGATLHFLRSYIGHKDFRDEDGKPKKVEYRWQDNI